jgi:hypothetical protein
LNVSLGNFRLLLNRILLFEVTASHLVRHTNPRNFMALLKYLAQFGPVMTEQLEPVSGKPSCLSYFSPDIQN